MASHLPTGFSIVACWIPVGFERAGMDRAGMDWAGMKWLDALSDEVPLPPAGGFSPPRALCEKLQNKSPKPSTTGLAPKLIRYLTPPLCTKS